MSAIKNDEFKDTCGLGNWFYIKYYGPKDRIVNKIIRIGFLRKYFKFKLFFTIHIKRGNIYNH